MVGNAIGEYDSFYELIRHALNYALDENGVDLSEDDREEILSTYHELDVFDDVHGGWSGCATAVRPLRGLERKRGNARLAPRLRGHR